MTPLRLLWLVLAVIGAILPWLYFWPWLNANGWDLGLMIAVWNANDATTGLVYDLSWAYLVIVVWVLAECLPRRDWLGLLAIPAGIVVGVSFGLPLYLFLRSRPGVAR